MNFGEKILLLRETQGISQSHLANISNISPTYLSGIEKGKKIGVAQNVIEKIAFALCSSTEFLIENKGFAYFPQTIESYLLFFKKALENANDVIFLHNFDMSKILGFVFVNNIYSLSMTAKISNSPNLLPQGKSFYSNVINMLAYKHVNEFINLSYHTENKPQNIWIKQNNSTDNLMEIDLHEHCKNSTHMTKNYLIDEEIKIRDKEYAYEITESLELSENEIFLIRKIRDKKFDIYSLMKIIDNS